MAAKKAMVSKLGGYTVFGLATLFGPGSVVAFFVFLFAGSPNLIRLELGEVGLLSFDAILCVVFFLQHSCMIRRSFRRWVGKRLPDHYDGAFFAIASGIVLLAFLVLWQESMTTVVTFQNSSRWFFHSLYFLCLAGFGWCLWALGSLDPFGIQPLFDHLRG
ncbi:MAG: hypothetical protein JXD19_05995, partial [Deltaproteobacteria bacterium]|nr:hypothetical protein [Deltaproteobacteria bacterium]